jgi:serine protease Do
MKKKVLRLLASGALMMALPTLVLAQEKAKDKDDEKKVQTIVITRDSNTDDKMVIEVDGDKVKVNGKDAKDMKDVHVHVNTVNTSGKAIRWMNGYNGQAQAFRFEADSLLFTTVSDRAMLGVTTQDNDKGAMIRSVSENSAAAKAGLKKGDIITRIGDKEVDDADDVTKAVHDHKPGDNVKITYLRDGKEQHATATLSEWRGVRWNAVSMPRIPRISGDIHIAPEFDMDLYSPALVHGLGRPRLGMSVQETEAGDGLRVLEVEDEGNAAKAGIKKDDVILKIDDQEVKTTSDVLRLTRQKKDKMNIQVRRNGKVENLELKFPKKLRTADL